MDERKKMHDFLTVDDLNNFNERIKGAVFKKSPEKISKEETKEEEFDPNKFESFTVNPQDIDNEMLHQLADIIDKKSHYNVNDTVDKTIKGPNTPDKILNSIAVIYITEGIIPVAVTTLLDPTLQNYKGVIPNDYYELKSGQSLENRVEQEFFAVKPDKHNLGLAQELKKQISSIAPKTFIINPTTDKETAIGLAKNGYKLISAFKTDWEVEPVELWIN